MPPHTPSDCPVVMAKFRQSVRTGQARQIATARADVFVRSSTQGTTSPVRDARAQRQLGPVDIRDQICAPRHGQLIGTTPDHLEPNVKVSGPAGARGPKDLGISVSLRQSNGALDGPGPGFRPLGSSLSPDFVISEDDLLAMPPLAFRFPWRHISRVVARMSGHNLEAR